MSNIFVISQHEGEYDDYRSWSIFAVHDEQKAKDTITDLEQRLIKANAARDEIAQHMTAWDQANPREDIRHVNYNPPFFKGPKKKWTNEQKAKLKKYDEEHRKNVKSASEPWLDWCTKRYEEMVRFTHTYSENIQQDIESMSNDASWEYDSITIIE